MNNQENAKANENVQNGQAVPMNNQPNVAVQKPPFYKRWQFWAGVGIVTVVGGAIILYKLGADGVVESAVEGAIG